MVATPPPPPAVSTKARKVLVVDDEVDVAEIIRYQLKSHGFTVEVANDPGEVIGMCRRFCPDLVILDVMMPDINGYQLCRLMRSDPELSRIPVVFLTAKTQEEDRIQGLEVGADDYICKPFSNKELVLRVQSILRRSQGKGPDEGKRLQVGEVVLDVDHHRVYVHGDEVTLTATEFRLLHLLMDRKGRVQSREHLLLNVWNYEAEIETRTVDTHIRRLREKLGSESRLVETVRGLGYRMVDPEPSGAG